LDGSKEKTLLGAINIDDDVAGDYVAGPARANDSSADLHVPSLYFKSSWRKHFPGSVIPLFESHQLSWNKELPVLGKVNHAEFRNTIFLKQALDFPGGDGAISASGMLQVTRTFVKAFIDMVSEGSVLSANNDTAEQFPEVLFD
jgi:hypothetical protein